MLCVLALNMLRFSLVHVEMEEGEVFITEEQCKPKKLRQNIKAL